MAIDDLLSALNSFQSNVTALQAQRIITGANDEIQGIRNSEASDAQKQSLLKNAIERATYSAAAIGVPGSTLDALHREIPEPYKPQNSEQAILFGTPEQKAAAQTEQQAKFQQAKDIKKFQLDYLMGKSGAATSSKADDKAIDRAEKAGKELFPDEKQRNAFGQNALSIQRANRIKAALGQSSFNSPADLDKANKIPLPLLHEAALGAASLVANGQTSDKSFGGFVPENIGSDSAKLESYVTNSLSAPQQAAFVKLYYQLANREAATAQDAIQQSVLTRAQNYVQEFKNPKTAGQMKNLMTTIIPGADANDFSVDENDRLTYKPAEEQKKVFNDIYNGLLDAKRASSSSDPQTKAQAVQKLKVFGYDPSTPINQIKTDVDYRTRSGDLVPLKTFAAQNPQYTLPSVPTAPAPSPTPASGGAQ